MANLSRILNVNVSQSVAAASNQEIRPYVHPVGGLFANGAQGAWYDPSDLSTLFQDSAGTIPVEKDGDLVELILDKSGNDNHAVQQGSDSNPVYRTDGKRHWLVFDGQDDDLEAPNITLGEQATMLAGIRTLGPQASFHNFVRWGVFGTGGRLSIDCNADNQGRCRVDTDTISNVTTGNFGAMDVAAVHAAIVADQTLTYRRNGSSNDVSPESFTGIFGRTAELRIGFSASTAWQFYGAVLIDAGLSPEELADPEKYLFFRTGVSAT